MANGYLDRGIQPTGYFTKQKGAGGVNPEFVDLLDSRQLPGAYRGVLLGNLLPADVGNYDFITKSSPIFGDSKFAGLFPAPSQEGLLTLGLGAINPFAGFATRALIDNRNKKALETLANEGILTLEGEGKYRIAPDLEKQIIESELSPKDFFQKQYDEQFGAANELAQYLDRIAYQTQGEFFQKDFFGNPTPYAKYVDRQGNVRPDALEKWKQFGEEDSGGFKFADLFKKKTVVEPEPGSGGGTRPDDDTLRSGIEEALLTGVAEKQGQLPEFLRKRDVEDRFDAQGRKLAGGTTNLILKNQ